MNSIFVYTSIYIYIYIDMCMYIFYKSLHHFCPGVQVTKKL